MKFIISLILLCSQSWALTVPPLTSPVEDLAKILTASEKAEVESVIRKLHKDKLAQLSVLIIPSLEGEAIEDYSIKVAEKWKLGTKEKGDGVLLLIAMKDRATRLEVGDGIEGELTDAKSSRIIDAMRSYMRSQDYKGALMMVVSEVRETMEYNLPEKQAERERQAEERRLRQEESDRVDAENDKKMKEVMGYLLALVLFGAGVGYIVQAINEPKALTQEKKSKAELLAAETQALADEKKKAESLKIDREKEDYNNMKNSLRSKEKELNDLDSSVSSMKAYVGDSV